MRVFSNDYTATLCYTIHYILILGELMQLHALNYHLQSDNTKIYIPSPHLPSDLPMVMAFLDVTSWLGFCTQ